MKALILKDLYHLSKSLKSTALVLACFVLFAFFLGNGSSFLLSYFSLFCVTISISSFSYDDFAKWDSYALTMPLSRKTIVRSKYALGLLLLVFGCALNFLLWLAGQAIGRFSESLAEHLAATEAVTMMVLLIQAVVFPCMIRYGSEKGRSAFFSICLIFALVFLLFTSNKPAGLEKIDLEPLIFNVLLFGPIFVLIVFILSYFLSLSFYKEKEF